MATTARLTRAAALRQCSQFSPTAPPLDVLMGLARTPSKRFACWTRWQEDQLAGQRATMQAVVAWFEPSEEINYTVICVAHLLFSLICGGLFIAEKQFPGTVDG